MTSHLPPSALAAMDAYEMLRSLYCMDGEFEAQDDTDQLVEQLRGDASSTCKGPNVPADLRFTINVIVEADSSAAIPMQATLPLLQPTQDDPRIRLSISQPRWMQRKQYEMLTESFKSALADAAKDNEDDLAAQVVAMVEYLKENNATVHAGPIPSAQGNGQAEEASTQVPQTFCRIWMHLPSLSSKSKRQDLVDYAPSYGITGIVSSGKPGMLILEAPSPNDVEEYLSYIKRHSWADIPAGHKKISERLREEDLPIGDRVFTDMREITEEVNVEGMKGVRHNRGDLGLLRSWLEARGLGDRLGTVLRANLAI